LVEKEKIARKYFLAWGRRNLFNAKILEYNNSHTRCGKIFQNRLLQRMVEIW
jgi:hypothetical protein